MTTTQTATLTSTLTALCALIPVLIGAYLKLQEVLRPLLARRSLRLAILATEAQDRDARAFLESLRRGGYRLATMTRAGLSCVGQQAVVVWCPDPATAAATLAEVQAAAPDATVLLLTYDRLDVRLSRQVLLSNSPLRLRGDVQAVAEAA